MNPATSHFVDPARSSQFTPEELERYRQARVRLREQKHFWEARLPDLERGVPDSHFLLRLPDGHATLIYRQPTGQQGVLNHVERIAERTAEWWRSVESGDWSAALFHGLGLGYHIPHLIQHADAGRRILVLESDPTTLAACLALRDTEALFAHPSISVALAESPQEAATLSHNFIRAQQIPGERLRFIVDSPCLFPWPTFLRDWFEELAHRKPDLAERLLLSLLDHYPKPANLTASWELIQKRPGIGLLFDHLKGVPAVVAGAGPGLEGVLSTLQSKRSSFLLVACDTALGPLTRAGIRPDLVIAMDSGERNFDHFRRHPDVEFLPVLYGGVFPQLLEMYRDRAYIAGSAPFPTSAVLEDIPQPNRYFHEKGEIILNQTVGASAFDLAVKLGCSPIFLAGVDLAYCDGKHHASGTIYEGSEDFTKTQPGAYSVPSADGTETSTCTAFLISLIGLIHQVGGTETIVYNLSRNGALTPGTRDREQGLVALAALSDGGERPSDRLRVEAQLAEKERRRPKLRISCAAAPGDYLDSRGRWRAACDPDRRSALLAANLQAFSTRYPEASAKVAEATDRIRSGKLNGGETVRVTLSEEGYPAFEVTGGSLVSPVRVPVQSSPHEEVTDWNLGHCIRRSEGVVFLGVGIGFHLRDFIASMGSHPSEVWAWEPYPDRLGVSLSVMDFRDLLTDERIHWSVGTSAGELFVEMSEQTPELLARSRLSWRPWVEPGYRSWARNEESDFIETWVRLFQAMRHSD